PVPGGSGGPGALPVPGGGLRPDGPGPPRRRSGGGDAVMVVRLRGARGGGVRGAAVRAGPFRSSAVQGGGNAMPTAPTLAVLTFGGVDVLDFCGPFEVLSVATRFTDPPAFRVFTAAENEA